MSGRVRRLEGHGAGVERGHIPHGDSPGGVQERMSADSQGEDTAITVTNGDESLPAPPVRDGVPGRRRQRVGEQRPHGCPDDLRRGVAQELLCALAPACHDPVRVQRGCHAVPRQAAARTPRQPVGRLVIGPVSRCVRTRSVTVHRIPPSREAGGEPASSYPTYLLFTTFSFPFPGLLTILVRGCGHP